MDVQITLEQAGATKTTVAAAEAVAKWALGHRADGVRDGYESGVLAGILMTEAERAAFIHSCLDADVRAELENAKRAAS